MSQHWRNLFDKDEKFLGSWNLEVNGKFVPQIVHIERFFQDTLVSSMGKESKIVCKLKEFPKPMVVNRTNFKRLETLFNSFTMDDFLNKPVTLQVEKVKSPDGLVNALRFSARAPQVQTPTKPAISDSDFPKALAAVEKGTRTVEQLIETRSLTEDQIKQLRDVQSK
jgi:hypothetical protein